MTDWTVAVESFLLAFPALFSIVNPVAGALIYNEVTVGRSHAERVALAGRIGFYSFIVMIVALWGGSYLLSFFGISISALRIGGGLVVAVRAWDLLAAPEKQEGRKQEQAVPATGADDVAFFPLTIPFTTGPGTISVAITLGANRPSTDTGLFGYFAGASAATLTIALMIWVSYWWSDRIVALLGEGRARILTRLTAFLLLCVGIQILLKGVNDVLQAAFHPIG